MSKIKEALHSLQTTEEALSEPGKSSAQTTDRTSAKLNGKDDALTASNAVAPGLVPEIPPRFRISVATQALCDEGLHPREEHTELVSQQFRRIKRPVLKIAFSAAYHAHENRNVVMLASALPGTGKTFCSFNLAMSIANEKDVGAVIVDADVLKPNISRAFKLQDRPGLIDFLLDHSLNLEDIVVSTNVHGLFVVPAGRQHDEVTELLASRRMQFFTESMSKRFHSRAIVVDTPPLLITNEAQVIAQHMGQIILVIEAGASSQDTISQALASLDREKPINAILNKAPGQSFGDYGDYGYYSAPK